MVLGNRSARCSKILPHIIEMKRQQVQAYEASRTCKQPKKYPILSNWTKIVVLDLFLGSADL